VLHNRNSNTALYTVLNSDFLEIERRLKTYLGLPLTPPLQRAAAIHTSSQDVEREEKSSTSKRNAKKAQKRKAKADRPNIVW
jgi:hypothetical protein